MAIRKYASGFLAAACTAMSIVVPPAHEAIGSSALEFDPEQVRWSRLLFQASHGLASARSEVSLAPVTAAGPKSSLLADAGGPLPPLPDADAMLMTATIGMSSKLPLVGDKVWETRVWFLPGTASALQRTRTKIGEDADSKTFRYVAEGVRRIRSKPESPREGEQRPESWSTVKSAFYPYGPARAECPDVSDPSLLLYVLSAVNLSQGGPPLELCVFNKKTLYHVDLRAVAATRLPVRFMRRHGTDEEPVEQEIGVLTIRISSHPMQPAEQEPEPFEFFEMRGDIEVSYDPVSGLPVQVRGTVNNVGEATFHLVEADLVR
jgi:hypothetical protein